MFRNLCGEGGFKNVVVLTTFWDVISNEDGTKRETQLKSKFFKDLIDGGARFMQHDQSLGSAQEVLKHVFTLSPTNVKIQEEIRVEGKSLEDTAAGSVHRKEVEDLIAKHRKEVSELKAEMDEVRNTNATLAQDLKVERDKLERKLKEWESERDDLKKGLDQEKQAVAQLKVDAEVEKKNQEQWRQDKERDWTNRLDSQAKMHGEELGKIQSQLDQEKEASRKREQQSQEMMRRLEERADNDRKALEDRRQEEERQWSMRMQAQADAHEKAVQKMQEQISKAQESPSGNVKQAEERMRRLEEKAEKDKKALEEKRQEDELQWSLRVKSQAEAHEKALLKIQEQQKKASENAKLLEAERRANAAERDKLAAERALQAERNKSWSKKGSEAANAIPVVGILAKPSFILGGAVLDLFDKARKK
ncbi:hypothetical protein AX14_004503 [Amanita brunnescens Koide BX004]|nr:hypothetical protein AX14_004503 [Amanita brunnescens Koide BX004]